MTKGKGIRKKLITFAMLVAVCGNATAQRGNGSERSPFRLSTADDMISFCKSVNEGVSFRGVELGEGAEGFHFVLEADIDLNKNDKIRKDGWQSIGTEAHPFKGHYDGAGYVVKCVNKRKQNDRITRLFGYVEKAELKNVFVQMNVPQDTNSNIYLSDNGSSIYNCVNADTLPGKMIQYFQGEYKLTDFDFKNIQGYEDGTAKHPFVIRDENDLVTMSKCLNGQTPFHGAELKDGGREQVFVLGKDMDMAKLEISSVYKWVPIGTPSKPFRGTFLGNGHTISNLRSSQKKQSHIGMFGYMDGARVFNLEIKDASMEADYNVGIMAGCAANSVITDCKVSGVVTGGKWIGGLCGEIFNTVIGKCEAKGCYVVANDGSYSIGGIIGIATSQSTIYGCKADAQISGSHDVGEICGSNEDSNVFRCASKSTIRNVPDTRMTHISDDLDQEIFSLDEPLRH